MFPPEDLTELPEQPGRLPRAHLSRRARSGLWLLRIVAIMLTAMITWTFVVDLSRGTILP